MSIDRTAYNALVDDDGSNLVGSIWNKNAIKTVLLDPIDALPGVSGAWTPYAAAWAGGDGVQPVLGNGILSGRYQRIGQWIDLSIVLAMGSTTTFGTSTYWTLTLPFTPRFFGTGAAQEIHFRAAAMSGVGAAYPPIIAYCISAAAVYLLTTSGALVNPTVPFTWSANAILSVRGSYEIA